LNGNANRISIFVAVTGRISHNNTAIFASTDEYDSPDEGDDQRDRVGNSDKKDRERPDDEGEPNCWGEVTRDFVETGTLGEHSSDPPGEDDNPRAGVGNQEEGHPSDHADTVGGGISDGVRRLTSIFFFILF
jgi:hypothetical protein